MIIETPNMVSALDNTTHTQYQKDLTNVTHYMRVACPSFVVDRASRRQRRARRTSIIICGLNGHRFVHLLMEHNAGVYCCVFIYIPIKDEDYEWIKNRMCFGEDILLINSVYTLSIEMCWQKFAVV